mmetsp:Transcript_15532/g.30660  ORF Transcript_15532/g.30660 Transcript_15532/m.30660 type:complete len:201 (-) Transcript_15532:197-799(-)
MRRAHACRTYASNVTNEWYPPTLAYTLRKETIVWGSVCAEGAPIDNLLEGCLVLPLIIANVDKHVVQVGDCRSPRAVDCSVEGIEHVEVTPSVVIYGDLRSLHSLEHLLVFFEEFVVCAVGMLLHQLRKVVRPPGVEEVDDNDQPVIDNSHIACKKTVDATIITAECFHRQQVMKLIVCLRIVHLDPVCLAVHAESLIEV